MNKEQEVIYIKALQDITEKRKALIEKIVDVEKKQAELEDKEKNLNLYIADAVNVKLEKIINFIIFLSCINIIYGFI